MTDMIRFLQNSVGEIHDSVKTYTRRTLFVHCQGCNNHVPVRVLDVLKSPGKAMEIKCECCSRVVCFTAGREYNTPRPHRHHSGPCAVSPFSLYLYLPKNIFCINIYIYSAANAICGQY